MDIALAIQLVYKHGWRPLDVIELPFREKLIISQIIIRGIREEEKETKKTEQLSNSLRNKM